MAFDLVLGGGHVIDPRNGLDGPMDVALRDGRIAAVGPGLGRRRPLHRRDRPLRHAGADRHPPARLRGFDAWLFPDPHCLSCGVTTVVDTGSSGFKDFERFRQTIMEPSTTRVLAFLNIIGAGMTGPPEQDTTEMEPRPCAEAVGRHPDRIVGTKSAHFGGPGGESAGGAIEAARLSGTIAMVDFSPRPTRTYAELLERFEAGDIHTHLYSTRTPLSTRRRAGSPTTCGPPASAASSSTWATAT